MRPDIQSELDEGSRLALALVDHLEAMGSASCAMISVVDRAEEYVVIVMPRKRWEAEKGQCNLG